MTTTSSPKVQRVAALTSVLALVAGAAEFSACTAEFETRCPDGTEQVAGGGDVSDACKPIGDVAGSAGTSGGAAGQGGSGVTGGQGGSAPMGVCAAGTTRCASDEQQTCGEDGQWGAAKACDISCDPAGSKCIVPVQVAVGAGFACALLSDGSVRCWGDNDLGQLGNGTEAAAIKPTPVASISSAAKVVAEDFRACVINRDGSAACWGDNRASQLAENVNGVNDVVKTPFVLVGSEVVDVALGLQSTCVVKGTTAASTVQCRGANDKGQLGNGTTTPSSKFETVQGLPTSVRSVGAGFYHACAVTQQGAAFCWGEGDLGQNGNPALAALTKATPVGGNASSGLLQLSLGYAASMAVRDDGALLLWGGLPGNDLVGNGEDYEARILETGAKILSVSTENTHSCLVGEDGAVWCWGYSSNGQVGVRCPGSAPCFGQGPYVRTPFRLDVPWAAAQVAVGNALSCALTKINEVYCWGGNNVGQVGVGYASDFEPPSKVVWKLGLLRLRY